MVNQWPGVCRREQVAINAAFVISHWDNNSLSPGEYSVTIKLIRTFIKWVKSPCNINVTVSYFYRSILFPPTPLDTIRFLVPPLLSLGNYSLIVVLGEICK